jgi:hypothetical protein
MLCRVGKLAIGLSLVSARLFAQETSLSASQKIELLMKLVQELQQQVKDLRTQKNAETADAPAATASKAATQELAAVPMETKEETASVEFAPQQRQAHRSLFSSEGIQWRGFGEVNFKALDQHTPELGTFGFVPGSAGGFYTGHFDLLLTSKINDHFAVLGELVVGEDDAQRFDVSMDRLLLNYKMNEHLELSFGRYPTATSYFNRNYHSGKWMLTSTDRPLVVEMADHGGILPTQAVGVSATGAISSGKLGLHYIAEYGSSDTIRPLITGDGEFDENNGNHVSLGLYAAPDWARGLEVGAAYFHDRISNFSAGPSVRLKQSITNVYVVYRAHGLELLNEGFIIRHTRELTGQTDTTPAFYTQIGKELGGRVRPYFRYQYINADSDAVFSDVGRRHGPAVGVRWDADAYVAFKIQLDHTLRLAQPALNGVQAQVAFTF